MTVAPSKQAHTSAAATAHRLEALESRPWWTIYPPLSDDDERPSRRRGQSRLSSGFVMVYICVCVMNLQRSGAAGACEAHNLEAVGSKPTFVRLFGSAGTEMAPQNMARAEKFFFEPAPTLIFANVFVNQTWTAVNLECVTRIRRQSIVYGLDTSNTTKLQTYKLQVTARSDFLAAGPSVHAQPTYL